MDNVTTDRNNQLYPKLKVIFCVYDECSWCQKYKATINMIASLGIKYEIVEREDHCMRYGSEDHGFPLTVLCYTDGFPLNNVTKSHHGGYMGLAELMEFIKKAYNEEFS